MTLKKGSREILLTISFTVIIYSRYVNEVVFLEFPKYEVAKPHLQFKKVYMFGRTRKKTFKLDLLEVFNYYRFKLNQQKLNWVLTVIII